MPRMIKQCTRPCKCGLQEVQWGTDFECVSEMPISLSTLLYCTVLYCILLLQSVSAVNSHATLSTTVAFSYNIYGCVVYVNVCGVGRHSCRVCRRMVGTLLYVLCLVPLRQAPSLNMDPGLWSAMLPTMVELQACAWPFM